MEERRKRMEHDRLGIGAMAVSWAISAGAQAVLLVLGLYLPKPLVPALSLLLALVCYQAVRINHTSEYPTCFLLPLLMSRVFFISALLMFAINIFYGLGGFTWLWGADGVVNHRHPFITLLVTQPVTVAMMGWALYRKRSLSHCAECIRLNGTAGERGYLGRFYAHEGPYQVRFMFTIAAVSTLIGWVYYFIAYINYNVSPLDRFIFVVAPALVYAFSVVFVVVRYLGIWQYYQQNFDKQNSYIGRTTILRFLIVHGEEALLKLPDLDKDLAVIEYKIDTPVALTLRRRARVTLDQATDHFRNITALDDFTIRLLYSNTTNSSDSHIYHYIVGLPSKTLPEGTRLEGEWFTMPQIAALLNSQQLTPLLSSEIIRVHTIATAAKNYDRDGRRRYKVKEYHSPFRLSEVTGSDIDFNDSRWLYVAYNNEDKRFFRLRRFLDRVFHKGLPS